MPRRQPSRRLALMLAILLALTAAVAVPSLLPDLARTAHAAEKTVYLPSRWATTGEVPWTQERTRESANFILLWGDRSGTDPRSAPSPYRFDPDDILGQLENLYSFYIHDMRFTPEAGLLAQHKIIVIITTTWSNARLDAWATGGSTDGRVGVINIAPGAAQPGSWGLAHELAHVFQNYTFLGRSGFGFTHPGAGTFWEASAEFMAMQVYPGQAAGDLTRFIRTENLAYSSSRHHYGAWMLPQYIKERDGIGMFNRIWNEARNTEHPLETYRRVAGVSHDELNRRVGEYAQRNVTWDYANRADIMPFINRLYPFITAYNGVRPEPVNAGAGHFRISDALAPSDYGYNKIRLVPSSDGALVRMRFRGHVDPAAGSGWTYGFVAVRNGVPRYGPLSSGADRELSFQLQPGEREVYLVVTGTPTAVHRYAFLEGYPRNYRYPYQFRLSGAVPYGYEPGHVRPAAPGGGRWHSNGGGWVDARANVAATAYVGPMAAVYGNSTVTGNARIEDLAWVNSGATVGGNAVVRDSALVQGGSNLGGSVVIGGDAEPAWACSSGTYLMFVPDRTCDGRANVPAEADINAAHGTFTDEQMAISGTPTPTPTTPPATASPSAAPSPPATASPTATVSPPVPSPTVAPPAGGCSATLRVASRWPGGYQAEVTVRAGSVPVTGWTVTWTLGAGQQITQAWGATVSTSGTAVTARNESWNGALGAGATASFGFIGAGDPGATGPVPVCSAR